MALITSCPSISSWTRKSSRYGQCSDLCSFVLGPIIVIISIAVSPCTSSNRDKSFHWNWMEVFYPFKLCEGATVGIGATAGVKNCFLPPILDNALLACFATFLLPMCYLLNGQPYPIWSLRSYRRLPGVAKGTLAVMIAGPPVPTQEQVRWQ